jgi:1-acyl-sn-glycerol-3-phosphate acyltransferase
VTPPRPAFWQVALATVLGNLYLVFGTLACALVALVAALVPPRGRFMQPVSRAWARGLLAASGVRLAVEHEAALDPHGRFVFLANHASLFDIPALLVAWPGQSRFLAKAGLFRIPVFGWALRLGGFVPVDRGHRERGRRSFARAVDRLGRGASVVVFPEEERALDGRLLPFRRGGLLLALRTGLPLVPVGLDGAFAVQSRRSFLIRPGTVTVRLGAPLDLEGESVRRITTLSEHVRARVAALARVELTEASPAGERRRQDTPV